MSLTSLISSNPSIKKSFPILKPYLEDLHCRKLDAADWKKEIKVPSI